MKLPNTKTVMGVPTACFWMIDVTCVVGIVVGSFFDFVQPPHPLSSPSPPAFSLSQHQGLFKLISYSHQWPKYWTFSFNICPSNKHSE